MKPHVQSSQKKPDSFFNTCVTVIAVLIVITLICMALIMFKCFSTREGCPNPGAAYNPYTNTALSCDSQECRNYVSILHSSPSSVDGAVRGLLRIRLRRLDQGRRGAAG
ncbi:hypothetical protein MTO96_017100 [Rhipicephalus appendiculatus]